MSEYAPWTELGFESLQDWAQRLKVILKTTPHNVIIVDGHACLAKALECHPRAAEKIGVGIHHFITGASPHGTKCFWVVREDGTCEDFSYLACLGIRRATFPWREMKELLRLAAIENVRAWKKSQPNAEKEVKCPRCRTEIPKRSARLVYVKPNTLGALIRQFCREFNVGPDCLVPSEILHKDLPDQAKADWRAFHKAHAQFRNCCPACRAPLGMRTKRRSVA